MRSLHTWSVSANLDLVRSIFAAWERGDFSSVEWADPEIEFVFDGGHPVSSTGMAGMVEGLRDFLSAWEGFCVEADEYRELNGDRVLVLTHFSGREKTSELQVAQIWGKGAHLFQVRGGKVKRFVRYWRRERALADLGLSPGAGAADTPG